MLREASAPEVIPFAREFLLGEHVKILLEVDGFQCYENKKLQVI